jgi:hypothetical protein
MSVEKLNYAGERVIRMSKQPDKAEENEKQKVKKPPEYRRFEKLLKQVVKAPPLAKTKKRPLSN